MSKTTKSRFFYGYVVVSASFIIWAVAFGATVTFGLFFKPLLEEFGWTRAMTSGAISLAMILAGFIGIIMGRLTDRFGPKVVLVVFGSFMGLSHLLMSQITNLWQFYLVYGVLMSIGISAVNVPILATVARWFVKRRGLMTGVVLSGLCLGQMIMAPVTGELIMNYGWRHSYLVLGSIVLVFIIAAGLFLKRDPKEIGKLPYGADELEKQETNSQSPDLQPEGFSIKNAIQTKQFWMLWTILFCFGFFRGSVQTHVVPFITDLGFSLAVGAGVLAAIGISGIIGRIVIGITADRIGNKQALAISFILVAASLVSLLVAKEMWILYLFAVIYGFSWGGTATVRAPIAAEMFGLGSLGMLLGTVEFAVAIGHAIGSILPGWIFDVSGNYQLAFLITATLAIIAAVTTSLLKTKGRLELSTPPQE